MGKAIITSGSGAGGTEEWVLDGLVCKTQSSTVSNVVKLSHTVTKDYAECWVCFSMNDSDNNNDNFCTVNSGNLLAIKGKSTYGSGDFNTWLSKFNSITNFNIAPSNYPFTYNFTWWFYKRDITEGTVIEIQKNQYGRDMFLMVIGREKNHTETLPIWVYM